MARLTRACPQLPASDAGKAAEWYRDKLGFTIGRLYPGHGFAIVYRDDIEVHFWTSKDRHIAESTSAYFRIDDTDALHATLAQTNEGGMVGQLADRQWGMRELHVTDPDGNLLKFGAPASSTAG